MQFLVNTEIDFMKYRRFFVVVSALLLLLSVGVLIFRGLNLGIDFEGGTQMAVRLRDAPQIDTLRGQLQQAGLEGVAIQRFGEAEDNEVLISVPVNENSEEGSAPQILAALDGALNAGAVGFDLNRSGSDALATLLTSEDPDGRKALTDSLDPEGEAQRYYAALAQKVLTARHGSTIFSSWDQIAAVDGVTDATMSLLQSKASLGHIAVLSTESVGPQIGGELKTKGILAIVFSLIGMGLYIWYRFELRFGIGALVAVFHDLLIVLGLFGLLGFEFTLSTIAAFLTLVGYSVNDTVVIFDRVRENMRRFRRMPLVDLMNKSINQTLSRTLITSGTTLMVVGCLYVLGGDVIRGFAFVLLIGVVVGTYSSIFVASPFALLWEKWRGSEARARKAEQQAKATA